MVTTGIGLGMMNMIQQLLMSLLLHTALHSDIAFLIVELLDDIIFFITFSDARNRLIAVRFIRLLLTTVLM